MFVFSGSSTGSASGLYLQPRPWLLIVGVGSFVCVEGGVRQVRERRFARWPHQRSLLLAQLLRLLLILRGEVVGRVAAEVVV